MNFLKHHPFPVQARFESSVVLTFAVEKEQLASLIPECLSLDTFQNRWAFIAVALVQTSDLRPKGFPEFLGKSFFLIGYRIFVRLTLKSGRRLRGLYILKSETDNKLMEIFGNIFTQYAYKTTDIEQTTTDTIKTIKSEKSKFHISIDLNCENAELPEDSPFSDWKDARKFAGPLPHTFTYNTKDKTVLVIEGVRQNWNPAPVKIVTWDINYLKCLDLRGLVLASAFEVKNVPYEWKKGRKEKWK